MFRRAVAVALHAWLEHAELLRLPAFGRSHRLHPGFVFTLVLGIALGLPFGVVVGVHFEPPFRRWRNDCAGASKGEPERAKSGLPIRALILFIESVRITVRWITVRCLVLIEIGSDRHLKAGSNEVLIMGSNSMATPPPKAGRPVENERAVLLHRSKAVEYPVGLFRRAVPGSIGDPLADEFDDFGLLGDLAVG